MMPGYASYLDPRGRVSYTNPHLPPPEDEQRPFEPEPGTNRVPGSPEPGTTFEPEPEPRFHEPEQRNNVPIVPVRPVPMEPVHEYPERHIHPVTYVHPEQVVRPELPTSIRPINSAKPDSTTRKNSESSTKAELIPNSSTELKPRPTQPIAAYKRVGRVGRQRKNEEEGEHGENPVREVVIYRHVCRYETVVRILLL